MTHRLAIRTTADTPFTVAAACPRAGDSRQSWRVWGRLLVCLLASLVSVAPALADNAGAVWGGLSLAGAHGDWRFGASTQYRSVSARDSRQGVLTPSVGRRLNARLTASVGYSRFDNRNGSRYSVEHRTWQQLAVAPISAGSTSLSLRTRLEQRSFDGRPDTAIELRQQFGLAWKVAADTRLSLALEPFLRLRTSRPSDDNGLAQVRLTASANQQLHPHLVLQVGYMLQHVRAGAGPDSNNHVALLQLHYRR